MKKFVEDQKNQGITRGQVDPPIAPTRPLLEYSSDAEMESVGSQHNNLENADFHDKRRPQNCIGETDPGGGLYAVNSYVADHRLKRV